MVRVLLLRNSDDSVLHISIVKMGEKVKKERKNTMAPGHKRKTDN